MPILQQPNGDDPGTHAAVASALVADVVDPLAALFRMGMPVDGLPCRGTHRVYDGREVFDLRLSFRKKVSFDSKSSGTYRGIAFECDVTWLPIAGRSVTKGEATSGRYTVWFAPALSEVPGGSLLVPIQATGNLNGVQFEAYATKATIDDQRLGMPAAGSE